MHFFSRARLGTDISQDVINEKISCKWIKLKPKDLQPPTTITTVL